MWKVYLIDLLIGIGSSVLQKVSIWVYSVLGFIAVVSIMYFFKKGDLRSYGFDKNGNFSGKIVFLRLTIVLIGTLIGLIIYDLAFNLHHFPVEKI